MIFVKPLCVTAALSTLVLLPTFEAYAGVSPTSEGTNAEVLTSTDAIGTLDIDDDLVPAIIPYLNCLTDSRGVRRYSDGKLEKSKFPVGADCREQRSLAAKNSVSLLKKLRRLDKIEIEDRVRLQFAAIDLFHAPRENKTETLSLAPELRNAFRGYIECRVDELRAQARRSRETCQEARSEAVKLSLEANMDEEKAPQLQKQVDESVSKIDNFFGVPTSANLIVGHTPAGTTIAPNR